MSAIGKMPSGRSVCIWGESGLAAIERLIPAAPCRKTHQTVRELRDGHAVRRALPWRALEAEFLDWIARRRAKSLTLGIVSAIFS